MNRHTHKSVLAHAFALAQHYQESRTRPQPRPEISADTLRDAFNIDLPEKGRFPTDVIDALNLAAQPGLMGNTGSNFFGWVMGASSQVGIAADLLTSAWGQNAGIYQTSPSAAIAEEAAASWLLDLLDLPRESSVGFTTGATMASFIGLAAARADVLRRQGWNLDDDGLIGAPRIQVVISEEAHASILAVLKYLGFGERNLIRIPTDAQGRMHITNLEKATASISGACIVIAQAGHINSGAFDRLDRISEIAQAHNAWFHIDGAFGLWARCSPRHRALAKGAELADSWAVDGHKWLQVPYDSGYAIVKNADAHRHAMSISASYLNQNDQDGRNPSEYGPELSRRARGFTTWAILQTLGRQGLREMVERHCDCARRLQALLAGEPGIRVVNNVYLNQVAVTFSDNKITRTSKDVEVTEKTTELTVDPAGTPVRNAKATNAVIAKLQQENTSFVSGANWQGCRILRVSVIADQTQKEDIDRLAESILRAWRAVQKPSACFNLPDTSQSTGSKQEPRPLHRLTASRHSALKCRKSIAKQTSLIETIETAQRIARHNCN